MAKVNENEEEMRRVAHKVFSNWDKEGNGDIDYQEFSKGLARVNIRVRPSLREKFWNELCGDDYFIEEEDLQTFLISDHENTACEGFKQMLIGAAERREFRRIKSTLDLDSPSVKKIGRRPRSTSLGNIHNIKPVPTRKMRLTKNQLTDHISTSILCDTIDEEFPVNRVRKRSVYKDGSGPTAPPLGPTGPTNNQILTKDVSDEKELLVPEFPKALEYSANSVSETFSTRLESDSETADTSSIIALNRPASMDGLVGEMGIGFQSVNAIGSSSCLEVQDFCHTPQSFSASTPLNTNYVPNLALKKKQHAIWATVINLLADSRRKRRRLGTGLSAKFAELIRSFSPYGDILALQTNFYLTDLQWCSFTRTIMASSPDGIFRFDEKLQCWTLVYKLKNMSRDAIPTSFTIDESGNIFFQSDGLLYSLPYLKDKPIQLKPSAGLFSRFFKSMQCTGGLCLDNKKGLLLYCCNDKVNSMETRASTNTVKTKMQLDANGLFLTFDSNRRVLYCSDVCGTIYAATDTTTYTVFSFNDMKRHGIVVDPVAECLLIHNKYIEELVQGERLDKWKLRRVCSTPNPGDVLTFDSINERLFFVDTRPKSEVTRIGILKFR